MINNIIHTKGENGLYIISDDVEKRLIEITTHHAHKVNDEYGLLYHKLRSKYEKYGCFPTSKSLKKLIWHLRIDILRSETRTRYKNGEKNIGVGKWMKSTISIDEDISLEDGTSLPFCNILHDPTELLPNDYEYFDFNLLLDSCRSPNLVKDIILNNLSRQEAVNKYKISEAAICRNIQRDCKLMHSKLVEISNPVQTDSFKFTELASKMINSVPKNKSKHKFKKNLNFIAESKNKKRFYRPCNVDIALEIYEKFSKTEYPYDIKDLCAAENISFFSFKQYCSLGKIPIGRLIESRRNKYCEQAWYEWLESDLLLNTFVRKNDIKCSRQYIIKWAKENNKYQEYINHTKIINNKHEQNSNNNP